MLVDRTYTATQYALLASIGTAGRTLFAASSGAMVDWLDGDWGTFFIITAVMAIPSLACLWAIRSKLRDLLAGKRVRVVGAGNIGARYASFCAAVGAEVAIWDPYAPDATFAAARVRRCFHLSELVGDSEIFVPMLPLTDNTRGLITAELIDALPHGSLVVQVTRAAVCDTDALYRRVLNDELALAADVFAEEPVPLDSPLLGRHNVVHTPHNAGRTRDANHAWVDDQIARFEPRL